MQNFYLSPYLLFANEYLYYTRWHMRKVIQAKINDQKSYKVGLNAFLFVLAFSIIDVSQSNGLLLSLYYYFFLL